MIRIKSLLKWLFSSRYENPAPQPQPDTEMRRAKGSLTLIRGNYEFHAGAVALMRVETSSITEETVYYPEDAEDFFMDLTSGLSKENDIILQVNKHPKTLGLIKGDTGGVLITPVELLGQE